MPRTKDKKKRKVKTGFKRPNKSISLKGNQYALGHHEGRPRVWTEEAIEVERQALLKWIKDPKNYILIGFANERDLHPEQIQRMMEYSKEFRDCYARARQVQEERLVDLAVSRKGDPNFIKFVLQNKSGWKEKNEISGDQANPLAVIMDRIAMSSRDPLEDYADE
jgi:hypothetical protein